MVLRIKNKWHKAYADTVLDKSYAEHASALAFIAWRLSLETARNLHGEGYHYDSDHERIGVITEFLAFLIHIVDRLSYERLNDPERTALVNTLGQGIATHMQENMVEIAGPGDYTGPFMARLNERLADYAELTFSDAKPGFDMLRYFGLAVLEVLGESQTNRWVIDQIIAIDGPEVADKISVSLKNLLA